MRHDAAGWMPLLTALATGAAAVAAAIQYGVPAVIPVLQRDPGGLAQGQWWRLATPLLVQTPGWYQVAANLVSLAVVGTVAEWVLGRWRWLALAAVRLAWAPSQPRATMAPTSRDSQVHRTGRRPDECCAAAFTLAADGRGARARGGGG